MIIKFVGPVGPQKIIKRLFATKSKEKDFDITENSY